jgi:uncharacterized protein
MEIMRLVITGSVGAGKSTFIRNASEIEVVNTDRIATDETAELKKYTTVAFDFGRLCFGPEMVLHLYGTPGQERFDFIWDMLIKDADAYILLVAAHRPHEFSYASHIRKYMDERVSLPMLIGITHADHPEAQPREQILTELGFDPCGDYPPTVTLNTNEREDVIETLIALIEHIAVQRYMNEVESVDDFDHLPVAF